MGITVESGTQTGLVLHAGSRAGTECDVARPPADRNAIQPQDYAACLPEADPQHLLLAAVPFSEAAGCPALVVYDESSTAPDNPCASRLTTNVENGLALQIKGDALVLYAQPGQGFGLSDWEQLDNAIFDELLEFFGQHLRPTPGDIARIVDEFKAGRFKYGRHEGEEDEDANKDDGGEELEEALEDAAAKH